MIYDVFLSFKNQNHEGNFTRDSELANELYEYLTELGWSVFFSNITLEYLGNSQYSKAIDDALDDTSILVAVGTSRENLESEWVRHEWDSFLNDIRTGRKPSGQVFSYTENIDISQLPRSLRQNQAFIHSSASKKKLSNFIKNALNSMSFKSTDNKADSKEYQNYGINRIDIENKKESQLFISYKSKDHEVARYISEALQSVGCNIWHAEYNILEKKENQEVEAILQNGTNSSDFAICLTNGDYAKSEWCYEKELIPLVDKIGKENIFELKIPKEEILVPEFNHKFGFSYVWQNSYRDLFHILYKKGIIEKVPPNNWDRHYCNQGEFLRNKTSGVLFDISGWDKGVVVNQALKYSNGYDNQRVYSRQLGDYKLNVHLLFQLVDFTGDDTSRIRKEDVKDVNEKEIYERNLIETKDFIDLHKNQNNMDVQVIGVHPFYILGYCHYGFTYHLSNGIITKLMRKYIINLPSKIPNKEHEIIITANASYRGKKVTKEQFLQVIPVFDQFVESMQYE